MLRSLALAMLAVAPPTAAHAQTAPAAVDAPDPARLAVAKILIERLMPADRRDAMVEQMVRPMMDNARDAMLSGQLFESVPAGDPKLQAAIDDFMKQEFEHSLTRMKATMPALADAMARAYARRFTLEQLQAISAFYETPAGRAFAEQAPSLMSDPDILAVQRTMMTEAMAGMEQRIAGFGAKMVESSKAK
jgi:hypothetical protein